MRGLTRIVDSAGRLTIPSDFRRLLSIKTGSVMEISVEGNRLVIEKHMSTCSVCGKPVHMYNLGAILPHSRRVCKDCTTSIKQVDPSEWEVDR